MLKIKQARLMQEIKQQEMADFLKVHVQTYRKIEENPDTATVDQAKRISERLGVSYDDLFFGGNSTLSRARHTAEVSA